jgi:hypothetical protein
VRGVVGPCRGARRGGGPAARPGAPPLPSVATALDSRINCAAGRVRKVVGALICSVRLAVAPRVARLASYDRSC